MNKCPIVLIVLLLFLVIAMVLALVVGLAKADGVRGGGGVRGKRKPVEHSFTPTKLSERHLALLVKYSRPEMLKIEDGEFLKPLLVERVSGTEANKKVRGFLVETLTRLGWEVELSTSLQKTPLGEKEFVNVIGSKRSINENEKEEEGGRERIVIAAHYDSKYFSTGGFIGALDSAVSCAILLDLARTVGPLWENGTKAIDLDLVFFDGEEAFEDWSRADSLYGSRHLAEEWEKAGKLKNIRTFVLLDLIGGKEENSMDILEQSTIEEFTRLRNLYHRLRQHELMHSQQDQPGKGYIRFSDDAHAAGWNIEDDHIPFKERGVPILHLIPIPFPKVWHKMSDDASAICEVVVQDWALLMRAFVVEISGIYGSVEQLRRGQHRVINPEHEEL